MRIEYVTEYKKHGCNWSNLPLAVVDLDEEVRQLSKSKPLEGFGSMSCFDAKDKALGLIKANHSWYHVLLGIPDLVVMINPGEWAENTRGETHYPPGHGGGWIEESQEQPF